MKPNTEEPKWSTCITFLHRLAGFFPALDLLVCCRAPRGKMRDAIDSDSPPTTDWRLRYWLASLVTEVRQTWRWIVGLTGCDMCHAFRFDTHWSIHLQFLFSGEVLCVCVCVFPIAGSMTEVIEWSAPLPSIILLCLLLQWKVHSLKKVMCKPIEKG